MHYEVGSVYQALDGRLYLCLDDDNTPTLLTTSKLALQKQRLRNLASLAIQQEGRATPFLPLVNYGSNELFERRFGDAEKLPEPSSDRVSFTWANTTKPSVWEVVIAKGNPVRGLQRIRGCRMKKLLTKWRVSAAEFDEVVEVLFNQYRFQAIAAERFRPLSSER